MRVLFLDIDGVLNNQARELSPFPSLDNSWIPPGSASSLLQQLDLSNCRNLRLALDELPDVQIVISSSWRGTYSVAEFNQAFAALGITNQVIGVTPDLLGQGRDAEIQAWLSGNTVSQFLALDDHIVFDLNDPMRGNQLVLDFRNGLTYLDSITLVNHFEPNWNAPFIPF